MIRINMAAALAAAVLLVLSGCSENPGLKLRFEAEKKLYQAERTLNAAQMSPGMVSPEMIDQARRELTEVSEFCLRGIDSLNQQQNPIEFRELHHLAFKATSELNSLLYGQRRFNESIEVLGRLLSATTLAPEEQMVVQANMGRSLQASGQWDSALTMYNLALETVYPPLGSRGELIGALFNLPAHIFDVATRVGDSVGAAYEFQRAVTYYSELAEKYPKSQLEASSRATLAHLYDITGQWQNEIAMLEALSDSTSKAYSKVRMKIADLYGLNLKQYPKAMGMYDSLLAQANPQDTSIYPYVLFKKALVRMEQKRFTEARGILTDLKRDYRPFFVMTPPAQLALARTFEFENNWDRAEVEYTALVEGYRGSDEAMGALLYVARKYEQGGRPDQAARWYHEAEEYYKALSKNNEGGLLDAKAMSFMAELAARKGDWEESSRLLRELYKKFPAHEVGRQAMLRAAVLHRERLADPAGADSLINELKAGLTEIQMTSGL